MAPYDPTVRLRQRLDHYSLWPPAVCPDCGSKSQLTGEKDDLLLRILDVLRARQRAHPLMESAPWNNRSELITLFATKRFAPSLPDVPGVSHSANPNSVDFSNPLQAVSEDFVPDQPMLGSFVAEQAAALVLTEAMACGKPQCLLNTS